MLMLENITKSYDKENLVLRDINLNIKKGEMVFIVGLSGAGKTTLMKLITREEQPTTGNIFIYDKDLQQMANIENYKPHIYRRKLGIVFQDYKLIDTKTVFENIAYPLQVFGENTTKIKDRVKHITETVGIDYLINKYPSELSGGESQRVGIARALINNPSILLLDEPTGNLDYRTTADIMNILTEINRRGTTIIMVTHDTKAVESCSGRILQVHDGMIIKDIQRKGVM